MILALVYFAAFTSIFFTISIFWQAGLGHTALESGLVSIPFAIGIDRRRLAEQPARRSGSAAPCSSIGTGMVARRPDRRCG